MGTQKRDDRKVATVETPGSDSGDSYVRGTIQKGDEGSGLLARLTQETWGFNEHVVPISSGMGGIAAVQIPETHIAVVYSTSGDPAKVDPYTHTASLAAQLFRHAREKGMTPLGLWDVIDSTRGDESLLEKVVRGLHGVAHANNFAILGGENAILGDRVMLTAGGLVRPSANVSGTMIAMVEMGKKGDIFTKGMKIENDADGVEVFRGGTQIARYANGVEVHRVASDGKELLCLVFDPKGRLVVGGSDGVGTKLEVYEQDGRRWLGVQDAVAMVADDAARMDAALLGISGVVERTDNHPVGGIRDAANYLSVLLGVPAVFQQERVAVPKKEVRKNKDGQEEEVEAGYRIKRLRGPEGADAYNINATAISAADEQLLRNPPRPRAGDCLVVIGGNVEKPGKTRSLTGEYANPRSNGFRDRRERMERLYGKEWHTTPFGRVMLEYLARPSTVFYPLVHGLWQGGLITAFYHMSGGALEGKLARPLAKEGLSVRMRKGDLLEPHPLEYFFVGQHDDVADVYRKLPLGSDAFVATRDPDRVIGEAFKQGFRAKRIGQLEQVDKRMAGVYLLVGKRVIHFSGKD